MTTPPTPRSANDRPPVRTRTRRALDLTSEQATILVRRTAYGSTTEQQEAVRVPAFATTPGRVRVGGGVTRNLGDMNFARVEVAVELPCYPEAGEIQRALAYATDIVDAYLREQEQEQVANGPATNPGDHNQNPQGWPEPIIRARSA